MLPSETRDLAQRLLAYETISGRSSELLEPAAFRVYEKLRQRLSALVGVAGFRSLISRALTLARTEAPSLTTVRMTEDGSLHGLDEFEPQIDQVGTGGVILITHILGLLLVFIGEALTLRLVQDVWPDAAFDDRDSGTRGEHEPTR